MQVTRPLLNYFGGKFRVAPQIIEHFPEHDIYCEIFGGALGVLLRKPRSKIEVINDLDERIAGLYTALRKHPKELQLLLELTPYSRREYRLAQNKDSDLLEDARRTIVASYMGIGSSLNDKTSGFRNSLTSNTLPNKTWRSYIDDFIQFHERINDCYVESMDFRKLIEKYDSEKTLFYLDPPYVHSTRASSNRYGLELTDQDHLDLLSGLNQIKGMAVLSGYESDLYDSRLPNWKKVKFGSATNGSEKTEVLWLCPRSQAASRQMTFTV